MLRLGQRLMCARVLLLPKYLHDLDRRRAVVQAVPMDTVADTLLYVFYAATVLALGFFIHKVLWLVQYKRIQSEIVAEAVRRLREGNAQGLAEWEEFAKGRWSTALGQKEVSSPSTFIRRVEEGLVQVRGDLRQSRRSIEELFTRALAENPTGPRGPKPTTVLSLRRLTPKGDQERYEVAVDLDFPPLGAPRPPDRKLYELNVRSRYGGLRRALVFFSGVADVVYSSQHVARMSQNVHVPTSTLVRRLSLVFLVLFFIFLDLTFSIRRGISASIEAAIHPQAHHAAHHAARAAAPESGFDHAVGTVLGFAVWLAIYGSISLAFYLLVRRRYQTSVNRLHRMLADEKQAMDRIHARHLLDLVRWGGELGRSLDSAMDLTIRQAEALIDHYGHRLRRRIAGPALIEGAKTIADSLFLKLPESRGELQDAATEHKHTLAHYVWPRPEEMGYQERLAQYRAAWQRLELAVTELRREQPDPTLAHETWRAATSYATVFAHMIPSGLADDLRHAYAQMVAECVAETDRDLAELDRRLGELRRSMAEQLEAARGLVQGRVELTSSEMAASVGALAAEIIQAREQARLEAMAFEI
jgi:hypothetical protein